MLSYTYVVPAPPPWWRWCWLFAFLNVADLATTWLALTRGEHEGNPLMAWVLSTQGMNGLLLYKLLATVVVLFGCTALVSRYPRFARVLLCVCNVLVALAVYQNLWVWVLWP